MKEALFSVVEIMVTLLLIVIAAVIVLIVGGVAPLPAGKFIRGE